MPKRRGKKGACSFVSRAPPCARWRNRGREKKKGFLQTSHESRKKRNFVKEKKGKGKKRILIFALAKSPSNKEVQDLQTHWKRGEKKKGKGKGGAPLVHSNSQCQKEPKKRI